MAEAAPVLIFAMQMSSEASVINAWICLLDFEQHNLDFEQLNLDFEQHHLPLCFSVSLPSTFDKEA